MRNHEGDATRATAGDQGNGTLDQVKLVLDPVPSGRRRDPAGG